MKRSSSHRAGSLKRLTLRLMLVGALGPRVMPLLAACVMMAACTGPQPGQLLAQARQLAAEGDRSAALVQYKAALQSAPGQHEVRIELGKLLLAMGDAEGASVELQRALADGAAPALAQPLLARAVNLTGDHKRVVHMMATVDTGDASADAAVLTQLAYAWLALGEQDRARAVLDRALAKSAKQPEARLLKARMLASDGRLTESQQWVDALIAENAANHEALLFLGNLYSAQDDRAKARDAVSRALTADAAHVPSHAAMIRLMLLEGDFKSARSQWQVLQRQASWHPEAILADAQIAFAEQDYARARERVLKLLTLLPDHETALVLAGIIEARSGSPVQAVAHFRKALSSAPHLDGARIELAQVEIRLGQNNDALGTLKPLLDSARVPAQVLALASEALVRVGNVAKADEYLRRAVQAAPEDTRLRTVRLLRRLEAGDSASSLTELEALAEGSKETYAADALFATRLLRREFDAALAVVDRMAAKSPGKASHDELRGRVYLSRGDLAPARQAFERALKLDPMLFGAVASLVSIDLLENRYDAAIARVQAVVDADPRHSVALMALGELKARNGAPNDEVVKLYAAAITASPLAAEPRLKQIEFALRKRLYKQALAHAQEARAVLPGEPRLMEAAGTAQMLSGDLEQAATTFRAMAGSAPESAAPYLLLARVYRLQNNNEATETALRKAVELEPGRIEAEGALVDLLVSTRRPEAALAHVRARRAQRPSDPGPYALEAAFQLRVNAADKALVVLREGLARTQSPDLAHRQFSLLLQMGRDAEAVAFGAAWLKQFPRDATIEYMMAVRDIARSDLSSAQTRLTRVVETHPTNASALNNLAWVMAKQRKPGAVDYARRAVSVQPDQPDLMDTLAMALAAEQRFAESLQIQRRVIELEPQNPAFKLSLARIALASGDKATARAELTQLQQLGSSFREQAEVSELLAKL
jgi:cellulose synthase operon protein C